MAGKPLTTEAIALTEKKMDMTLDDIIKMSKNKKTVKQQRVSNKSQKLSNNITRDKLTKVQRYMESRSSLRQGVLAKRRSNFQGNQFPGATEIARKAVAAPLHNKFSNRNRMPGWKKTRFRVSASRRSAAAEGFVAKRPLPTLQQQQQNVDKTVPKQQRPHTLDSLFANMKEQRMRDMSRQHNAMPLNGGWNRRFTFGGRGRFGN